MSLWDTSALIAKVRRVTFAPNSTTTGTADSDLLLYLTDELHSAIVPRLRKAAEEYFVTYMDTAITAGQATYPLPSRAVGSALRDLWLVDSQGQPKAGPLGRSDIGDVPRWGYIGTGSPQRFYLKGADAVLLPTPGAAGDYLRMYFEILPGALCATSAAGVVTGFTATTVTISGVTFSAATVVDFVKATPPFQTLGYDATVVSGTSTLTFAAGVIPATLAVGDYVCPRWKAPVAQIPVEFHPLLAQRTAVTVLKALGDTEKLAAETAILKEMQADAAGLITPRVVGKAKTLAGNAWGSPW